jgi:hypothetical protein
VIAVGPRDSRAVEPFPHHAVQALTDRQLVPIGATAIPEPLNVDDDYGPMNSQPSILHLSSPSENKAEAKLSLIETLPPTSRQATGISSRLPARPITIAGVDRVARKVGPLA